MQSTYTIDPWRDFTSALKRHGRAFDDIAQCTDKRAVIRALGFSDVLLEASIESRWVEMVSGQGHSEGSRDILKDTTDSRRIPSIPSSMATNLLIDGIVQSIQHRRLTAAELRTHILSLPIHTQENYLIYELLHALVGCPGVFILTEEPICPPKESTAENPARWEEANRFAPREELRPFFHSAILPIMPIINAFLSTQRSALLLSTNNSQADESTSRTNAAALGLGEALAGLCTEYVHQVENYANTVTDSTTIGEVVLQIKKLGQKICYVNDAMEDICSYVKYGSRTALNIVHHDSTDGVGSLLNALYDHWTMTSGDIEREQVVSYLLAKTSQAYIDFIFQWMKDGVCAKEVWDGLFLPTAEKERMIFPIASIPTFLKNIQSSIVSCGQWRNTRRVIQTFVDSGVNDSTIMSLYPTFETPRFDWRFLRRIEETVSIFLHSTSADILQALQGRYSIQTQILDVHRVLLCRSNDWVGTFASENLVQLAQPTQRGRYLGWLTERMHRAMHHDRLPSTDCMIENFVLKQDEHSIPDRLRHFSFCSCEPPLWVPRVSKDLYAYLSLDISFPELLLKLGFFDSHVREQYGMVFRLILWVKCMSLMQRVAWKLGRSTSVHRSGHKMLPSHHLLHQIGLFLSQLDGWIHHTAIPMFIRKLDSQLREADNVGKLIHTHSQLVRSLVEMCFLLHAKQQFSLTTVLQIIQGILSKSIAYSEESESYRLSNVLFSTSEGDAVAEESKLADIIKLERELFDCMRGLVPGESSEKNIPSMDFSSFCT
ncbi:gamma-tubulin complex subunit [Perkinsela sp. CCAP 1560/4]|nr:gamma-tubulin complex subunit [Perkinsela sp. CCAP 1560/4]|eukprot:KNH08456.1 gamma-tubulin complex subunit [Perkinsela sp. CCAP 1560/4]